jgi:Peptidase family M23
MRRLLLTLTVFFALTTPANAGWIWPVTGDVITPYRNGTDPYATGQHRGIDIEASVGTPVVAAVGGDVRFAGTAGSSGLTISIRTGDGYDTSYLHLSSLAVRASAHVSAGERIGAVGTTGTRSATAPHLHFGVRDAGTRYAYRDPLAFLPPPPVATPTQDPPRPAPAPAPQPAPPATAPAPAPRQAPAASPRRLPAPVRLRAPAPRSAPRPQPAPRPAPRPLPVPEGAPRPVVAPRRARQRLRAPGGAPDPLPRLEAQSHAAHGPRGAQVPYRASAASLSFQRLKHPPTVAARRAVTPHQSGDSAAPGDKDGSGLDIGWALACAGLLLAAAILGLTGDRRQRRVHAAGGLTRAATV